MPHQDDMNPDKPYWVAFNMAPGVGPAAFSRLLAHFDSLSDAWRASETELTQSGLDRRAVRAIVANRPKIAFERELARAEQAGITVLTWDEPGYPARLREIYHPPPVIYVRGSLLPEDERAVAVVGTRHASAYGRDVAERLSADLARHRITVVSGLARGIDSAAHRAALAAGGRTIAVFGCGIDIVYPAEHRRLAEDVAASGALVSEFPLGTRPQPDFFPRRNRIMSGLALGVLVAEAPQRSGALITASFAAEQGRDVFAVPGSIFAPSYAGCHDLLRDGAKLVTDVKDILEELNVSEVAEQPPLPGLAPADATEALLLRHLSADPTHIDEVRQLVGLPIATVSSTMALMELKGMVRHLGGMNYVRAAGYA